MFRAGASRQLDQSHRKGIHHGHGEQGSQQGHSGQRQHQEEGRPGHHDPDLEAEGQAEESKGDLTQAGEKIKDAFKK